MLREPGGVGVGVILANIMFLAGVGIKVLIPIHFRIFLRYSLIKSVSYRLS